MDLKVKTLYFELTYFYNQSCRNCFSYENNSSQCDRIFNKGDKENNFKVKAVWTSNFIMDRYSIR